MTGERQPLSLSERFRRAVNSIQAYRKRQKGFVAQVDYWVYMPGAELPNETLILHRMLEGNPHSVNGVSPIGRSQAIYFSDIRFEVSLVKRDRNVRLFRRGQFPEGVINQSEQVEQIEEAASIAKIGFVTEEPMKDTNYAAFCLHEAEAVADLASGTVIYDRIAERIWSREELASALRRDPKGMESDFHLRSLWINGPEGGWVETRGLRKVGLQDLKSVQMESDQQVLITAVMDLALEQIWKANQMPEEISVRLFDDEFKVVPDKVHGDFRTVRILRVSEY